MNSLLIYPEWPDTYWSFKHALPFEGKRSAYPPLGLLTVASMLPKHWQKKLVDTNVRPLTDADLEWADVALLSGMLVHKQDLLAILARCRARGLRTVIGGPVTSSVEELPLHADHVVIGEAGDPIVDDNFIGNKKKVKELLPVLRDWNVQHQRPFTFFTEASVNLADDADLLQMMKDACFTRVFLGIETPVEASLKEAQKLQNTRRSLMESVRRVQSYGMEVMAGFIMGFDNDPEDVFDKQVEFIQESAIPLAMVGLLLALPGTQLYRRLMKEGRIVDEGRGDNMDLRLNFIPRMNAERLVEGYRSILRRIYHPDAYYERVRRFLAQYRPTHHRPRSLSDYLALGRSILKQGVLGEARASYWKFFLQAATRYRHAFDTAITLAIMGYHFQTLTRVVCDAE